MVPLLDFCPKIRSIFGFWCCKLIVLRPKKPTTIHLGFVHFFEIYLSVLGCFGIDFGD